MEELLKLAKKGQFGEVERGWMQALEGDVVPWQELIEVAEILIQRKRNDLCESLLWYLVVQLKEQDVPETPLAVALRGCTLLPESEVMRDEVTELYPGVHGDSQASEALLKMTLGNPVMPSDVAIRRLRLLERLTPGAYVRADPGARLGHVEGLDVERGKLVVAFEDGTKEYDAASAERLDLVEPDDFRALALFKRDRLASLARENPEELIVLALRTFGGRVELNRLRLYVEPVLRTTTWPKWWSAVKRVVQHSPVIGLTEGKPPSLFLHSRPVGREEQIRAGFDKAATRERLSMALQVIAEAPRNPDARRDLLEHFSQEIAGLLTASTATSRGETLAALAVLEAIERSCPDVRLPERPSANRWLEEAGLAETVSMELPEGEVLMAVLDGIRRWLPERWRDIYVSAMVTLPRNACEAVAKRLGDDGAWDALAGAAKAILERPDCSAGALVWLWKACSSRTLAPVLAEVDRTVVLRRILAVAASISHARAGSEEKRCREIAQIRQVLLTRDRSVLRHVIENADEDTVRSILSLVERNPGLAQPARSELALTIRGCRPSLFRKETPPWEEDVIYTTQAGLGKRKAKLDYILKERLPQVIKEIGEAARFGDLSENAEYTAALEERGRLATASAAMQEELERARLITAEMAATRHVGVGSRVLARNLASGEVETLRFLGPWDADPSVGIYHYKAPVGLAFMGRRAGEKVTFRGEESERSWEIIEIAPAV